jgi:hypothetical protein
MGAQGPHRPHPFFLHRSRYQSAPPEPGFPVPDAPAFHGCRRASPRHETRKDSAPFRATGSPPPSLRPPPEPAGSTGVIRRRNDAPSRRGKPAGCRSSSARARAGRESRLSVEQLHSRPNRTSTTGTMSAARPTASTMRLRSGRLAKRQIPRYKPKRQNITACRGTTHIRFDSAAARNSGGKARLKRSQ